MESMRAVLWDLDGTLADTEQLHFRAWNETMGEYGVEYDFPHFRADFGRNNGEIIPELLGSRASAELVDVASRQKEDAFRRLIGPGRVHLLAGAREWLEAFDGEGVVQAVASSGSMSNIAATIHALGIGDYFRAVLAGQRMELGKPHPALFLQAAAALARAPRNCIVIEDSPHGVEAARRGGMASVVVGPLAHSARLAELLARVPGRPCLPVETLEELSWAKLEELWRSK